MQQHGEARPPRVAAHDVGRCEVHEEGAGVAADGVEGGRLAAPPAPHQEDAARQAAPQRAPVSSAGPLVEGLHACTDDQAAIIVHR